MADEHAEITVEDNPTARRYDVFLNGDLAGFAAYRLNGQQIVFTHTGVDDAFEGHGLGSRLVAYALDDVRRRGLTVVPRCPFVAKFIEEHEQYADLVA